MQLFCAPVVSAVKMATGMHAVDGPPWADADATFSITRHDETRPGGVRRHSYTAALRFSDGVVLSQQLLADPTVRPLVAGAAAGGAPAPLPPQPHAERSFKVVGTFQRASSVPLAGVLAQSRACTDFLASNPALLPKVRDRCGIGDDALCRCFAIRHGVTADRVDVLRIRLSAEDAAALDASLQRERGLLFV